jgi:cyclophilin family peptidyl-prolyl cis-trans isomerase
MTSLWRIGVLLLAFAMQATPRPVYFSSPPPLDQMRGKQAVVDTTMGTFVIQLLPEAAPNHVGLFMKLAADGSYVGTAFHRVIKYGVIQGGDPLSKDPSKAAQYGQGGLNQIRAEPSTEKHTAGAVSTVTAANLPDSGGTQFFICVGDQPALDGQYTVFGRVVDGIDVVQAISAVDADADGRPRARVEIKSVTIRNTPVEPFVNDTPATLGTYRAALETPMGSIEMDMLADKAPETVRAFLRMAQAGVYDQILVHRVAANFVIQTGALSFRQAPLTPKQQALVHNLPPEFTDTANEPGVVSMARGDDPASAQTSFFICTGACRALDGKYTAFARVTAGSMAVLNAIAAVPVDGETPKTPILVTSVRVEKR